MTGVVLEGDFDPKVRTALGDSKIVTVELPSRSKIRLGDQAAPVIGTYQGAWPGVELVRAPAGQIPKFQKTLTDHVDQLRAFLEKNPPKSFKLVPGGPEFPPVTPQVAEAPLEKDGDAGVPGR